MFSEETEAASPPWWSHRHRAKGLWTLVGNFWPPIALTGFENRTSPSRQNKEAPGGKRIAPQTRLHSLRECARLLSDREGPFKQWGWMPRTKILLAPSQR